MPTCNTPKPVLDLARKLLSDPVKGTAVKTVARAYIDAIAELEAGERDLTSFDNAKPGDRVTLRVDVEYASPEALAALQPPAPETEDTAEHTAIGCPVIRESDPPCDNCDCHKRHDAQPPPPGYEGDWVMVPRDLTKAMLKAADTNANGYIMGLGADFIRQIWANAISKAPPPPKGYESLEDAALALDPEEQHQLAIRLAANVGYDLTPEPEHPDSPHAPKGYEGELVERIEARLAEPLEGRTGDAWERGRRAGLREALEIGRGA